MGNWAPSIWSQRLSGVLVRTEADGKPRGDDHREAWRAVMQSMAGVKVGITEYLCVQCNQGFLLSGAIFFWRGKEAVVRSTYFRITWFLGGWD